MYYQNPTDKKPGLLNSASHAHLGIDKRSKTPRLVQAVTFKPLN